MQQSIKIKGVCSHVGSSRRSSEDSPSIRDCRLLPCDRLWYSPVLSTLAAPDEGLSSSYDASALATRASGDVLVSTSTDPLATLEAAETEFVPASTDPPTTGGVTGDAVLVSTLLRLREQMAFRARTEEDDSK